jgi:predicted phage tail protein
MKQKTDVRLYGFLRQRYGRGYTFMIATPADAIRLLAVNFKDFRQVVGGYEPGFRIVIGKAPLERDEQLHEPSGRQRIGIVPVVAGAAGGGKILAGIALIGLSFVPGLQAVTLFGSTTLSSVAFNLGVSLALGGIAQALAGTPKAPTPIERPDNQPSYAFNGPVNVTAEGQPVPLAYGRVRVGSVVISSGLSVAQLPA